MNFFNNKQGVVAQLVYGALLIILIVVLISINSFSIIKKYKIGLNESLNNQAYIYAKSIYTLLRDNMGDNELLQKKVESLIDRNSEIKNFTILEPREDGFEIVVSTNKEQIGKRTNFYLYKMAWNQKDYQGIATDAISAGIALEEEDKKFADDLLRQGGNWFVALPMFNQFDQKEAILSIMISSQFENDITQKNQISSLILTMVTIIVVIMFLAITLRIWDYALLYNKMKEVDKMKDEFISMASHELRTPVTGIKGYSSMILDGSFGEVSESAMKGVSIIKSAADRLAILVEDLLDVSRIEQGRIEIKSAILDPDTVIKEIIEELKIQADSKKINLLFRPHKDILPKINIDPDRLKQILINIIGNSIKYTEKGMIEVITEEKNKKLFIKIKDTGIGMSSEAQKRLFQKFYRVKNDKTKEITGTGLGLWITKRIIELMNGNIEVESIEGVGSQFSISFEIK